MELRLDSDLRALMPARVIQIFDLASKLAPSAPQVTMRGQELRVARALSIDDAASAGFVLDFIGQGARIMASAHGPSAALLAWALHTVAVGTKSALQEDGKRVEPAPDALRAEAFAYLDTYEADVTKTRDEGDDLDSEAFVAWLAREELVEVEDGADFADLPMDDAERLYELLLDHEDVAEVFVSEREIARLLGRFLARAKR